MGLFDRLAPGVQISTLSTTRIVGFEDDPTFLMVDLVHQLTAASLHPWTAPAGYQIQRFALMVAAFAHTMADELLTYGEAAFKTGEVPKPTADLAVAWAAVRDSWVVQSKQLAVTRADRIAEHLPLVAPIIQPEGRTAAVAKALIGAADSALAKTTELLNETARELPWRYQNGIIQLRSDLVALEATVRRLVDVKLSLDNNDARQADLERQAFSAITALFTLTQKLALPYLIGVNLTAPPLPFDVWAVTDPAMSERAPVAEITEFWGRDPDPTLTYAIQTEIDFARSHHHIRRTGEHADECPWASVYYARQGVNIGGVDVAAGERFVLEVDAGIPYRRGIRVMPPPPKPAFEMPEGMRLWFLTDPGQRQRHEFDEASRQQILDLYESLGEATLRRLAQAQEQIEGGRTSGVLRRITDEARTECPWQSVYRVRRQDTLLGTELHEGDLVYLDTGAKLVHLEHGSAPEPVKALPADVWVLTDPAARREHEYDAGARVAMEAFWLSLPDQAEVLRLHAELEAARGQHAIRRRGSRPERPWQSIYYARQKITLAGIVIREQEEFYVDPYAMSLVIAR
jgi:hypothetical protein